MNLERNALYPHQVGVAGRSRSEVDDQGETVVF